MWIINEKDLKDLVDYANSFLQKEHQFLHNEKCYKSIREDIEQYGIDDELRLELQEYMTKNKQTQLIDLSIYDIKWHDIFQDENFRTF